MLDLDHFKEFNDRFGHPAGDEALRVFAHLLQSSIREPDVAARYGGEEFAVIFYDMQPEHAEGLAERLRREIQDTVVRLGGGSIRLTASFGVAVWPRDGRTPEALLDAVDRALYAAKQAGRNRVIEAGSAGQAPLSY